MKKSCFLFFVFICSSIWGQFAAFNLKGLTDISVRISDEQNILTTVQKDKLISDIKLKLLSAGVKISSKEKSILMFNVSYVKSTLEDPRILTQVFLIERVKVLREKELVPSAAITFTESKFFTAQFNSVQNSVIDSFTDELFVHFLDNYLKDKEDGNLFSQHENTNGLISDLTNIASLAQVYFRKPTTLGGGANSFIGFEIPKQLKVSSNGTYTIAEKTSESITFIGIGNELGKDRLNRIRVTMVIGMNSIISTTVNN